MLVRLEEGAYLASCDPISSSFTAQRVTGIGELMLSTIAFATITVRVVMFDVLIRAADSFSLSSPSLVQATACLVFPLMLSKLFEIAVSVLAGLGIVIVHAFIQILKVETVLLHHLLSQVTHEFLISIMACLCIQFIATLLSIK